MFRVFITIIIIIMSNINTGSMSSGLDPPSPPLPATVYVGGGGAELANLDVP